VEQRNPARNIRQLVLLTPRQWPRKDRPFTYAPVPQVALGAAGIQLHSLPAVICRLQVQLELDVRMGAGLESAGRGIVGDCLQKSFQARG